MKIEQELHEFLRAGKQLQYDHAQTEPGYVALCHLDDLEEGVVWIEGSLSGKSYYEIPAISLTNDNDYYDPEYILLWLPNEQQYGTWDCDHWVLYVFEQAKWQDIAENPAPYINCQWDESQTVGTLFQPQGVYPMKQGWPL